MPNNESAKKRVRQSAKRHSLNMWRKRRLRDQTKAFLLALQEHDVEKAETEYRKTVSLLDKVSSTSTMHKNTASRRKSRLNRRLKELRQRESV